MITKKDRLATGCVDYFRNALAAIGRWSAFNNTKYPPADPPADGSPRWSFDVSTEHADAIMSHLSQRGTIDPETGFSHTVALAWRALALLETELIRTGGATPGLAVVRGLPKVARPFNPDDFPALQAAAEADRVAAQRGEGPEPAQLHLGDEGIDRFAALKPRRVFRVYHKASGERSANYPATYDDREVCERAIQGCLIGQFYEQHRDCYEIREEDE